MPTNRTLDYKFSKLIRARDQRCVACCKQGYLEAAHIFGRASKSTRWDMDNAVALCHQCHCYFTTHPAEWEEFCRRRMGDEAYEALGRKARLGETPDADEVNRSLNEIPDKASP